MAEPTNAACDECGMQFPYQGCEREIYCPGCNQWQDYGRECSCSACKADDREAAERSALIDRIAEAVNVAPVTVAEVLALLCSS